jgi:hypothetical protein
MIESVLYTVTIDGTTIPVVQTLPNIFTPTYGNKKMIFSKFKIDDTIRNLLGIDQIKLRNPNARIADFVLVQQHSKVSETLMTIMCVLTVFMFISAVKDYKNRGGGRNGGGQISLKGFGDFGRIERRR